MSCCTNTYNLGCHFQCSVIPLPVVADATKTLSGIFTFAGISYQRDIEIVSGETIELNLATLDLPELGIFDVQLYNPDGTRFTQTVDDVVYDCFFFSSSVLYGEIDIVAVPEDDCLLWNDTEPILWNDDECILYK